MIEQFVFIVVSLGAAWATFFLYALLRASGLHDRRMSGFGALCIIVPVWILLNAFDAIVSSELYPAVYVLKAFPLNIVPYMSCWFILNFTESKAVNSRAIRAFLVAMPLTALAMLATNPLHGMYILSFENPPVIGPLFIGHMLLSILFILAVYFILFRYILKHYQKNPLIIVSGIGTIIPVVLYLLHLFSPRLISDDYTPIGYFFTILFVAYATYYHKLGRVRTGTLWHTLAEIAKSPQISDGTVEGAARLISREACIALDAYRAGVWSYDEKENKLKNIISYSSAAGDFIAQDAIDLSLIPKYKRLLETEKIVLITNNDNPNGVYEVMENYDPDLCSLADAPIWRGEKFIGVVCVEQNKCTAFPEKRQWSTEEQSFVSSLADIMSIAITNSERSALMARLEKELSVNSEFTIAAINNSPIGIMMFDKTLNIIDCNDAVLELFGVTKDYLIENYRYMSPEYQPCGERSDVLWMGYRERIISGEKVKFEWLHCSPSGELLPCEATVLSIKENDEIIAGLAYVYDMRDIKKAQKDLEKRDEMLREALYREVEAGRAKTDFLAKMSHEIRTPMNAIIGMSELALRERTLKGKDEHIITVKQAGSNLLELINDILNLSKIEAGKIEVARSAYSVASLLTDTVNIIRMKADSSKIHFAIKVSSAIPESLYGDETKMRQTLLNILGNAVKYTEAGHVILTARSEAVDEGTVNMVFEIIDSGIGIKSEDMDKLFVDFMQLNAEMNKVAEGVGLGLYITRSIVNAMGGSIAVESDYGKGSTFTITVPQEVCSHAPIAVVDAPELKKVLLYERRNVYAESIAYAFDELGINYCVAADETGLRREMETRRYNYLFIDYDLYTKTEKSVFSTSEGTKLVILTDFGGAVPDEESSHITLTMPIYCTQIADLLSDKEDAPTADFDNEFIPEFTAPGARVLIVDDIRTNIIVAKGLLKPYNMRVDLCDSGAKAIEAVQAKRYDLVFMDHKMPGMDGVEATKRIRSMGKDDPYYKDVPIIALTANAVFGMREHFISNGFNDFLSKPIDMLELNKTVDKWLPDTLKKR